MFQIFPVSQERLERLKDPGSELFEVGTFVNHGRKFGKQASPAAGVVTAFARVEGRWTMVIANDNTVASGAWWPLTPEKIERAQEMARRLRLPVIYLVDCSGLYLPEQSHSFPGRTGAGHIFQKNSLLSSEGVPQIAGETTSKRSGQPAAASSSHTSPSSVMPSPPPPYSSGRFTPRKPAAASSSQSSTVFAPARAFST